VGERGAWFGQAFAIAVIAHIVASAGLHELVPSPLPLQVAWAVLGAAAVWLFLSPSSRRALAVVAALVLPTVWLEAPFLGNHWLLAGFVSVAVLVSLTRPEPWAWFLPTARAILLGFYGFAAFAKLNSDFFDAAVSCAVEHSDRALSAIALPGVASDGWLAPIAIGATALIELSVFGLLLIRRTRPYGVMVGTVFHLVISFDISQHFYDFTSILFVLFGLFVIDVLPPRVIDLTEKVKGFTPAIAGTFLFLSITVSGQGVLGLVRYGSFLVWIPVSVIMARQMLTSARRSAATSERPAVVPSGALGTMLIALVVVNGVTPYTQLKTATAWNMYSNLSVTGDSSNHFIVRSALPIGDGPAELVEILASDDEELQEYVGDGYLVPAANLWSYLDRKDGVTVDYRTSDGAVHSAESGDGDPPNALQDRLWSFRSVDGHDATRCLLSFGVLR